jgi:1-aminocyclopropane-1-carboxylate deaminase/D-cysteine desulfhydrase-like pyridoxal-dependent ACC family enzyme
METFNVVIATMGSETIQMLIDSISSQFNKGDCPTIICDCQPAASQINSNCQTITIQNEKNLGLGGQDSSSRWQNSLPGDYAINGDTDLYLINNLDSLTTIPKDYFYKYNSNKKFNHSCIGINTHGIHWWKKGWS